MSDKRRQNHAVWIGIVLLGLCGPGILDPGPWTGLLFLALFVTGLGVWRAYRRSQLYRGKLRSLPGFAIALFLTGFVTVDVAFDPTVAHEIVVDGQPRTYRVYMPGAYDGHTPVPVVLAFHGDLQTGRGLRKITRLDDLSDREGFLAVYPEGINRSWNDGRGSSRAGDVDDVAFVRAMLDSLERQYAINPRRVYATGFSRGASFSVRLACEVSDRIAAVAAVATRVVERVVNDCRSSQRSAASAMFVNGTADRWVRWEASGRAGARWAELLGCQLVPDIVTLPDLSDDGTRVRRESYDSCPGGREAVMYAIEGGGHTWPGGRPYLPRFLFGRTSRDLDVTDLMWRFFEQVTANAQSGLAY